MSFRRTLAIAEGRAMIRVRYIRSHDLATIGVCPGCWNSPERREALIIKLKKMDVEVVHKNDIVDGVYKPGNQHAPACPYGKKEKQEWKNYSRIVKNYKYKP